jgi:CubicO group peptidase (beta-lactamase class C family)
MRHPSFPDVPITTRMLLTHTSGLEDDFLMLGAVTDNGNDPTMTLAEFTESYATPGGAHYGDDNWGAAPGTRRSYCNAGFGAVGAVLEAAGDASLREQTEAAIFDVLDMDGAGWFLADIDLSRVATPYTWGGRGDSYTPQQQTGMAFYPAGSLRVSVTGLARFLLAIDGGGALDGARILTEESVAETLRIQFPDVSGSQALTWSRRRVADHLYIGHSGSTLGGSTQMLLSTEGTHGIILLTNSDAYLRSLLGREEGDRAMEAILERLDAEALAL